MIFYINDILVVGLAKADCREKVIHVAKVLENLGFLLNLAKSSTEPSQVITYLGFVWDLRSWMVSLKSSHEVKIHELAAKLQNESIVTSFEFTKDDPEQRYTGAFGKSNDEKDQVGIPSLLHI